MEVVRNRVSHKIFDGEVPTYIVRPSDRKPHPAVVLAMDAFGVTPWIEARADRLAEEGLIVAVPDLYHRCARRSFDREEQDQAFEAAASVLEGQIVTDMQAVLENLNQPLVARGMGLAIVGHGFGGRVAVQTACHHIELRAAAVYCPTQMVETPRDPRGMRPIDRVPWIRARLLVFYGGKDERVPDSERSVLAQTLTEHRKHHEIVVYPEAGHAFYNDESPGFDTAAAKDSWERTLRFLRSELRI